MAIAFFRISRNTVRTEIIKDATPIVVDESHPIAEEVDVLLENNTGFKGEFLDSFGYQVSEDGTTWSNEANVTVSELVEENTPTSTNQAHTSLENTETVLYDESLFPINSSTDRIKIQSIGINGTFLYNGQPALEGLEVYAHNIPLISFLTKVGGGEPYFEVSYICGNHLGYNEATTYTISINVFTLAAITFISSSTNNTNVDVGDLYTYPYRKKTEIIEITDGYANGYATISLVYDSVFFVPNSENRVSVKIGPTFYHYYQDGSDTKQVPLDENGTAEIIVEHYYVDRDGSATTSQIEITIDDVDGNVAAVSGTDVYTSLVSYVAAGETGPGVVTLYRARAEDDEFIYAGYELDGSPKIKRTKGGIDQTAAGVTDLETDWTDRLNLTYS